MYISFRKYDLKSIPEGDTNFSLFTGNSPYKRGHLERQPLCMGNFYQAFSRARVLVVRSQTSLGPKYWMAPG